MSWDAGLPRVDVPQGDQPKAVTIVLPYYENPQFLRTQVGWWSTFPEHLKAHLSAIVVDDGSPEKPAVDVLQGMAQPFPIRLFRIQPDIRWNWLAARNIGTHHAADGWLVLTDMDHMVPQSTASALIYGQHDPLTVYGFSRIEHTGEQVNPHSASFLMTRDVFWRIGGYDERFSGHYGSDGQFRRRVLRKARMQILTDRLVRHEYDGDSSTTTYTRKDKADNDAIAQIAASIPTGAKPKVLSFPYEEVLLQVAA